MTTTTDTKDEENRKGDEDDDADAEDGAHGGVQRTGDDADATTANDEVEAGLTGDTPKDVRKQAKTTILVGTFANITAVPVDWDEAFDTTFETCNARATTTPGATETTFAIERVKESTADAFFTGVKI